MDEKRETAGGGRGGGRGGDAVGQSEEAVDYESHQVINDFINGMNRAAVIGVTQG